MSEPFDLMTLVRCVEERATDAWRSSELHGDRHSRQVAQLGRWLPKVIERAAGADPAVVLAFAVLHDSQRLHDGDDPEHGRRAAKLSRRLRRDGVLDLTDAQSKTLAYALKHHSEGRKTEDATIGTCWDADRLALMRCGVVRDSLLSTVRGRKELVSAITAARVTVSAPALEWEALDTPGACMELYHGTCHHRVLIEGLREGRPGRGIYFTPTRQIAGDYILRSAIRTRPMPDHGYVIKVRFGATTEFTSQDRGVYGFCLPRPFVGREDFVDIERVAIRDIIKSVHERRRRAELGAAA